MKAEIRDDHIGIFKDALSEELVDNYIAYYKKMEKEGIVLPRSWDHLDVTDTSVHSLTQQFELILPYVNAPFVTEFFTNIYPIYAKKYSLLKQSQQHTIFDIKVQKTLPGEGYHTWHAEVSRMTMRNRILAFSVFLNDVKEGGETEFLYQKCRFKPKRNTLLLWPAGFTHTHRGNPPLSGEKYIITGWVEYGTAE